MIIAFYSNYLNHHQLPFCLEMAQKKNVKFFFVASNKTPQERLDMGYEDMNNQYDFVIKEYEDKTPAKSLANDADIIIVGGDFPEYIKIRKKTGKIMLRYSERIFKEIPSIKKHLGFFRTFVLREPKKSFLLCSGAYAKRDFNQCLAFINKTYRWGYFPAVSSADNYEQLLQQKQEHEILWTGRFIYWKHPESAIFAIEKIKKQNISCHLTMVGDGPLLKEMKQLTKELNLEKEITFTEALNFHAVRDKMKTAHFFLFTSDRREGWGAVLNESMSEGCIPIANRMIGSVPYLIKDSVNGFIYDTQQELEKKLKESLLMDSKTIYELSIKSYKTIQNEWNAKVAADRLIHLASELDKTGKCDLYSSGPCSRA